MRSHYDVLGVDPAASREDIRRAYRHLVRQLHPDRQRGLAAEQREEMTARLVAVTDAWKVLGDDDKRLLYDQVWQAAARRAQLVASGRVIRPDRPPPRWRPPASTDPVGPSGWSQHRPPHRRPGQPPRPPARAMFVTVPEPDMARPGAAPTGPSPSGGTPPSGSAHTSETTGPPPAGAAGSASAQAMRLDGWAGAPRSGAFGPAAARWGGAWPPPPWLSSPPGLAGSPRGAGGLAGSPPGAGSGLAGSPPAAGGLAGSGPGGVSAGRGRPVEGCSAAVVVGGWTVGGASSPDATTVGARTQRRARRDGECRLCGSAPAVAVDLRGQRSGVLRTLFTGGTPAERGPLCRSCGMAVLRELTDVALCGGTQTGRFGDRPTRRTLVADVLMLGWLFNLLTVIGNLSFWFRLHRLAPPSRDPEVRSPLTAPLDPEPPLRARRGGAVLAAVLAVVLTTVLALVVVHTVGSPTSPSPGSTVVPGPVPTTLLR